ncbi:MAG: T9SS type A sorting domain-containing protein [Chitinophagaceae bacterium]
MRKIFTLSFLLVSIITLAGPFTPGNIVVVRIGDGTTALSAAAAPMFLEEYTTGGALVQTIALPVTASGANKTITSIGNSTSVGSMNISTDRAYITFTGYDAAVGTPIVAAATAATINRVVAFVDAAGVVNTTTALTDAYSTDNIRGAYSTNGTDVWLTGTGVAPTNGVRYTTKGSTTSVQLNATAPTNVRGVAIYNGQLYCTSASGVFQGVCSVGTGTPTTTGQTITALPGFPTATGPSAYAFEINPYEGNTLYVADDRASTVGGIQKWTLTAGTWSLVYTLNPVAAGAIGCRGVTVDWRTTVPVIYATGTDNKIYKILDNGTAASSTVEALTTPGTNQLYRGVAFVPGTPILPVTILSFDAQKLNGKNELTWKVAQETDLNHYEVERSADGRNYTTISQIAAVHNSTYSFSDTKPASLNYYRIKLVDKNGKTNFTKVVVVLNKENGFVIGDVYPTLTNGPVNVEVFTSANSKIQYTVSNLAGQKMISQTAMVNQFSKETIDLTSLTPGLYLLQVSGSDGQRAFKIVKQ